MSSSANSIIRYTRWLASSNDKNPLVYLHLLLEDVDSTVNEKGASHNVDHTLVFGTLLRVQIQCVLVEKLPVTISIMCSISLTFRSFVDSHVVWMLGTAPVSSSVVGTRLNILESGLMWWENRLPNSLKGVTPLPLRILFINTISELSNWK